MISPICIYRKCLTDVVVLGESGRVVCRSLVEQRPELKVVFMSGYTDDAIVHHGVLDKDIPFIPKSFTPGHLAQRVRDVLDPDL